VWREKGKGGEIGMKERGRKDSREREMEGGSEECRNGESVRREDVDVLMF